MQPSGASSPDSGGDGFSSEHGRQRYRNRRSAGADAAGRRRLGRHDMENHWLLFSLPAGGRAELLGGRQGVDSPPPELEALGGTLTVCPNADRGRQQSIELFANQGRIAEVATRMAPCGVLDGIRYIPQAHPWSLEYEAGLLVETPRYGPWASRYSGPGRRVRKHAQGPGHIGTEGAHSERQATDPVRGSGGQPHGPCCYQENVRERSAGVPEAIRYQRHDGDFSPRS